MAIYDWFSSFPFQVLSAILRSQGDWFQIIEPPRIFSKWLVDNAQKINQTIHYKIMKISARNILKGIIKSIKKGPISSIITLEVAPGVEITASVTSDSVKTLKLKKGQPAYAIIKASSVLVGVD